MWFMTLLTWVAMVFQLCFVTLSLAAGLYYLAELVEEFTVMTGRIIRYLILATSVIYVFLFVFEDLPKTLIVCGVVANVFYYMGLQRFPYIEPASAQFIASIVILVFNHYLAFSHFATVWHPFSEVLAYFTVCLWLIPFAFFISLTANENVLPTVAEHQRLASDDNDIVSSYFSTKGKKYGLLAFLKSAQDTILPQRIKKSY